MSEDMLENAAYTLLTLGLGVSLWGIKLILPVPIFIYRVALTFCRTLYHLIYQLTYTSCREEFAHENLDHLPTARDDLPGEPYAYTPLPSNRYIRLLELKYPDPWDFSGDSIECNLIQVSLDNPLLAYTYRAISYTWDGQQRDRFIMCNGKKLAITRNCELILQHFMHYARLHIWIDAICIDQDSEEDKSMQIPLMAEIYGGALMVNVWLGLPIRGTGLALSYIWLSWCFMWMPSSLRRRMDQRLHALIIRRGHTDHIVDLIRRKWWRRVWTIQESVLARQVGWTSPVPVLVNCGHYEMPFDALGHLLLEFNAFHLLYQGSTYMFNSFIWSHYMLSHMQPRLSIREPVPERVMPLRDITLAMFRSRASAVFDQRDRIYGLYSVFTSLGISLSPPSPTKTKEELYQEFTREACQATQSLDLLSLVDKVDSSLGTPSWVPDFTSPFRLGDTWESARGEESATPVSPTPQFSFESDGKTLRCDAIFIDRVKWKTGSTIWKPPVADPAVRYQDSDLVNLENSEHAEQTILAFFQWAYLVLDHSDELVQQYGTREDTLLALGNVLTIGRLQNFKKLINLETPLVTVASWVGILIDANYRNEVLDGLGQDPAVSPQARAFIGELLEQGVGNEPNDLMMLCVLKHFPIIARFTHAVWMHNEDKVLFVTEGGLLGSTNMSLKEGDAVFRLLNVDKPMVLRQVDDKWTVVGPAYVEGIMKGERWREGVAEEISIA